MCIGDKATEQSVVPSGIGKTLLMGVEPVVDIGEDSMGYLVDADSCIIILRASHRHCYIYKVIYKEGREDYKCGTVELLISPEKEIQCRGGYHRIIRPIAEIHQFAENGRRKPLREQQRRLTTEKPLFPRGKHMVEIGEHTVELVGVGIPPGEQRHLCQYAAQAGETAGQHTIHCPQGGGHEHNLHPAPKHFPGVMHLGICE